MQTFDIFRIQPNGELLWLDAVDTLADGKNRAIEMSKAIPGRYFLFNQETKEKVFVEPCSDLREQK
jgi:hypothetical protein